MEKNQVDINLSTDIKTDNLVPLNITLMSRDINNNSFLLKFKSNGADVQLNNSFTVEILSVFPNSKIEILTQAVVYGNTAMWEFDTKYITRNEVVSNYVYVKKDGAPIISADANAFTFNVGLSKIDGNAGKTAESYDRNYEKVLHEFEVAINLTKDEWAQMANDARNLVDETRNFVDEIKDATVDEFVELKMGEELANLEVNYATRLVELETNDQTLTTQLADIVRLAPLPNGVDDTDAIQQVLDEVGAMGGGDVRIPSGDYWIKADKNGTARNRIHGLSVPSNVKISMDKQTVLNVIPTNSESYAVFFFENVTNATIEGGKIIGDKRIHIGVAGEWGHGIVIRDSENLVIKDIVIEDCFGDGMYIANNSYGSIIVEDVKINNCRRHEATIISGKNIIFNRCNFFKIESLKDNIVNMSYGGNNVDLEQNGALELIDNVTFQNCKFSCATNDSLVSVGTGISSNLKIIDNHFYNATLFAVRMINDKDSTISGNHFYSHSFEIRDSSGFIISNNRMEQGSYGFRFDNCSDFKISKNKIKDMSYWGIRLLDCNNGLLEGNTITNAGATGGFENQQGIRIQNSSDIELMGEKLLDMPNFGILLQETDSISINGGIMKNMVRHAIRTSSADNTKVSNVEFVITDIYTDKEVVHLYDCESPFLTGNRLRKEGAESVVLTSAFLSTNGTNGAFAVGNDLYKVAPVSIRTTSTGSNSKSANNRVSDGALV